MKLTIDTTACSLLVEKAESSQTLKLYSRQAFEEITRQWLRVGWNQRYQYTFTWMGCPIIQLPDDIVRLQEVIYRIQPDVILETGVAHGGSLMLYASLAKAIGKGRVIGIDVDIRPHNRKAIESHPLAPLITLLEGSSIDPGVVAQAKALVKPGERTIVVLDSNHTKAHVLAELDAYCDLVTPGAYIVATDGIMRDLHDVPRGRPEWAVDNPAAAAAEFAQSHPEFVLEQPLWPFNESTLIENATHWSGAWLRRLPD